MKGPFGNDYLTAGVLGGPAATGASMTGMATLTDNHGNSTSGHSLTCSGKPAIKMTDDQWRKLYQEIAPYALLAKPLFGPIVIFGHESPLQTMCRKRDADAHHAP